MAVTSYSAWLPRLIALLPGCKTGWKTTWFIFTKDSTGYVILMLSSVTGRSKAEAFFADPLRYHI
jgi:hypothetical protein